MNTTTNLPPSSLSHSDRLYGRDKDYETLTQALQFCIVHRQSGLVLVDGPSGVGKTTLVHRFQEGLGAEVYFLEGKYYQHNQGQPFQALIQVIEQYERRIAALPAARFRELHAEWQRELEPYKRVLQHILPASVLYEEPANRREAVIDQASLHAQVLKAMAAVFRHMAAGCEALVVFTDDLQWADRSGLEVLQYLLNNLTGSPVLFAGTYRTEEGKENEALQELIHLQLQQSDRPVLIHLEPFSETMATEWLAERLNHKPADVDGIGEVIWRKTLGNPFYLNQFYQLMKDTGIIYKEENGLSWQWRPEQIEAQPGTENLVPALKKRLSSLDAETMEVLKWAACLGASFDAETLSELSRYPVRQVDQALARASEMGFALPQNIYDSKPAYVIAHDQIQQALYDSIAGKEKEERHLKIARYIIQKGASTSAAIYQIANHLRFSGNATTEEEAGIRKQYHHKAARQALAATAYGEAFDYCQPSLEYFTASDWEKDYHTTLDFYLCAIESAGYNRDAEMCRSLFEQVREQKVGLADEIRLLQLYSLLQIYFGDFKAGYELAKEGLKKLGVHIADTPEEMGQAMQELVQTLAQPDIIAQFDQLPLDPEENDVVNLLFNQLCVYAFNVSPQDIAYYTFQWAKTTLDQGRIVPPTSEAYSFVAMVYATMRQFDVALKYGELTEKAAEEFDHPVYKHKALTLVYCHSLIYKTPYGETMDILHNSFGELIRFGEWIWAGGTLFTSFLIMLTHGTDLGETAKAHHAAIREYTKPDSLQIYGMLPAKAIELLLDYLLYSGKLPGEREAEDIIDETMEQIPMISSVVLVILCKLYVISGHYEKALPVLKANYEPVVVQGACGGQLHNLHINFDYVLTLSRTGIKDGGPADKERAAECLGKLKEYAELYPTNFEGYYTLALANMRWAEGNTGAAYGLMMEAIKQAKNSGLTLLEAMACEHIAELAAAEDLPIAKGHFIEAFHLYRQCGAEGKALEILQGQLQGSLSQMVADDAPAREPSGVLSYMPDSDVKALMDSSLALSKQVKPDLLLRQLMEIISRHTGAERVLIALKKKDDLYLEGVHGPEETRVLEGIPLSETVDLPAGYTLSTEIVNAVSNTRRIILLGDAYQTAGPYKNTQYIRETKPKSVLCMPLMHQGDLMGVLYLENNSQAYAFTRDRLEILTLLSAQIATSIRNAGMYSNLEEKVARRTQELQLTNKELETMSEFKEKLTGLIAHDLKSPLSNIIGLSEQEASRETHEKINQLGRYMEQMILDILETRRLESPGMDPELREVTVDKLLGNALEQLGWIIKDRHIQVAVQGYTGLKVLADERLMIRVLVNLINNAIVHNPNSANITVKVGHREENRVRVAISDKGSPMPEQILNSIFAPYQSHTGDRSSSYRSTGLGLTYCKLAVESHGGSIGAEAAEGTGNTFWFTLSAVEGQEEAEAVSYQYPLDKPADTLPQPEAGKLAPFAEKLKLYQVNQLTAILNILREIDQDSSEAMKRWVTNMEQAAYACDQKRYTELLKQAKYASEE